MTKEIVIPSYLVLDLFIIKRNIEGKDLREDNCSLTFVIALNFCIQFFPVLFLHLFILQRWSVWLGLGQPGRSYVLESSSQPGHAWIQTSCVRGFTVVTQTLQSEAGGVTSVQTGKILMEITCYLKHCVNILENIYFT